MVGFEIMKLTERPRLGILRPCSGSRPKARVPLDYLQSKGTALPKAYKSEIQIALRRNVLKK
ncbi:hypothetical protein Mapa_008253 [Marchantia paleacea]|nr:hypothetical protein Mapa_008253 [Marchantia paleacea]